jgi:hypothetical protein
MSDQPRPGSTEPEGEQPEQVEPTPFEPQEQWLTYIERVEKPTGERKR